MQSGRQDRQCKQIIKVEFDKGWAGNCGSIEEGCLVGVGIRIKAGFSRKVTFELSLKELIHQVAKWRMSSSVDRTACMKAERL